MVSLPRKLRQNPTIAEIRSWRILYPIRQLGWHIRKQAPIGRYVVDFVCHSARLIVEIDGETHFSDTGIRQDAVRTAFLEGEGYRVLRFNNREVLENEAAVYDIVLAALEASSVTPSQPPPSRGR
ncbi:endonuclease domain-containing protein [Devosia sp. Naph2]|uniref:endonuclease domain-containing protein n=1 Tax=Devosia polycyclovorans TaxID=3345148 RepID=UPI0035CF1295